MKLMTAALRDSLPALYSTEGVPLEDKVVHIKFFDPFGHGYWLVVEGDEHPEFRYLFFGYAEVTPGCGEWGYFTLQELESLRLGGHPRVERDLYHSPTPFSKFIGRYATA